MAGLQTEYDFTLPKGYIDDSGTLHRRGVMRLATARDEIEPLRDPNVADADDPYLTLVVLSRVVVSLGSNDSVSTTDIEGLFAADLAFLQDFYGIINFGDPADLAQLQAAVAADEPVPTPSDASVAADDVTEEPAPKRARAASKSRRAQIEEVSAGES